MPITLDTSIRLVDGSDVTVAQLLEQWHNSYIGFRFFGVKEPTIPYSMAGNTLAGEVLSFKAVYPRLTRKDSPIVELELSNGVKIRCAPTQLVLLNSGAYKEAQKLLEGEQLRILATDLLPASNPDLATSPSGDNVVITSVTFPVVSVKSALLSAGVADLYDIRVPGANNYGLTARIFVHDA